MGKWVKYRILIILLAGFTYGFNAQAQEPPPPMASDHGGGPSTGQGPCDRLDTPGGGKPPPPPPGLCLPINDYLFPLFLSGVALGAFSLFYLQKKQETTAAQ